MIFKSIESEGRWGGNGLELGSQRKCQVLNGWLFGVSSVKVEPLPTAAVFHLHARAFDKSIQSFANGQCANEAGVDEY